MNGAPCRLLDVQELLADTGVGRQQHVIIGQGQLDTILQPARRTGGWSSRRRPGCSSSAAGGRGPNGGSST